MPLVAQQLRGIVRNAETLAPLHFASVTNLRNRQMAFADSTGHFSLQATAGDVLAVASPGFATMQRRVPPVMGALEFQLDMEPLNFTLNEVLVRPKYTAYQIDSIERHSTYQRTLARQKNGSVMSPVSALAEALSTKQKRLYRFKKEFARMEDERFIDTRYTPTLVAQMTGLQGDTLAHFMNSYPMPYDYARTATDLELKMWIRTQYKAWMKEPHVIPQVANADSVLQK